jgi:hypothetical protein
MGSSPPTMPNAFRAYVSGLNSAGRVKVCPVPSIHLNRDRAKVSTLPLAVFSASVYQFPWYLRATLDLPEGLPGIVMAIHTFGEYLDFHPHLHALVADSLFVRSGLFHVLPDVTLKPLEELFRARVITFLVDKGLLPPARANMLRGWVHSGFNMHRSRRVLPDEREDIAGKGTA